MLSVVCDAPIGGYKIILGVIADTVFEAIDRVYEFGHARIM